MPNEPAPAFETYAVKILLVRLLADFVTRQPNPRVYLDNYINAVLSDASTFAYQGEDVPGMRGAIRGRIEEIGNVIRTALR